MQELKRIPTPMPGTTKAIEHHSRSSTSSLYATKHRRSHNRRGSNEILNYVDHIIDNGAPLPQQLGSREITKPYTRLCDAASIATTAAQFENSLSSLESFNEKEDDRSSATSPHKLDPREITKPYTRISDTTSIATTAPLLDSLSSLDFEMEETDRFSCCNEAEKKEDQSNAVAIWAWDSGLELKDDEIDIWDDLLLFKNVNSQS